MRAARKAAKINRLQGAGARNQNRHLPEQLVGKLMVLRPREFFSHVDRNRTRNHHHQ